MAGYMQAKTIYTEAMSVYMKAKTICTEAMTVNKQAKTIGRQAKTSYNNSNMTFYAEKMVCKEKNNG
jgi:hypothetical protein